MTRFRTRSTHVEAIRIPRSIDINPDAAPTRDEVFSAAMPIVQFLGQSQLRSEHATVRIDSGRVQVTVHQRPHRLFNGAGSDWIVKDEYGVFTIVDERTFRAFYEPDLPTVADEANPTVIEAIPLIETVLRDINVALEPAGYKLTYDLSPILPPGDPHRLPHYEEWEPELPADPTGIDCAERYESPADGA